MSGTLGSSLRRFRTVFAGDLAYHARRPLFIVWALILVFTAWGLSSGAMQIQSGDATVGGTKAFITSEFAVAMQLAIVTIAFLRLLRRGRRRDDDHPGRAVAAGRAAPCHAASSGRIHLGQVRGRAGRLRARSWCFIWRRCSSSIMCCPTPRPRRSAGRFYAAQLPQARAAVFAYRRSSSWRACRSRSASGRAGRSWSSCCRWPSCSSTASSSGIGRRAGSTRGSTIVMMWIDPSGLPLAQRDLAQGRSRRELSTTPSRFRSIAAF